MAANTTTAATHVATFQHLLPDLDLGVEPLWWSLRRAIPLDDHVFFIVSLVLVHAMVYWCWVGVFHVITTHNLLEHRKLQKGKHPSGELVAAAARQALVDQLVVQPVVGYFLYTAFVWRSGPSFTGALPSLWTVLGQLAVSTAIFDTLLYWSHRMHHHPIIYKHVHKQHHRFYTPVVLTSEYAHPLEELTSNLLPALAGPLLLGMHHVTFLIWMAFTANEAVAGHCGYEVYWCPLQLIPGLHTSVASHDYHHSHNIEMYGGHTWFWDWLMGTDQAFTKFLKEKKEKESVAAATAAKKID